MVRGFETLIPYHRTVLRTPLAPSDVSAALARTTSDELRWFGGSGDGSTFRGKVDAVSFEVSRRIRYRNSFLPIVHGTIESTPGGSTVRLRLRLHAFVAVFMAIWMGGASFAALGSLVAVIQGGPLVALVTWGFPIFGASLCGVGFRIEGNRSIEQLCALWGAHEDR